MSLVDCRYFVQSFNIHNSGESHAHTNTASNSVSFANLSRSQHRTCKRQSISDNGTKDETSELQFGSETQKGFKVILDITFRFGKQPCIQLQGVKSTKIFCYDHSDTEIKVEFYSHPPRFFWLQEIKEIRTTND
jgi:hypothetical protein